MNIKKQFFNLIFHFLKLFLIVLVSLIFIYGINSYLSKDYEKLIDYYKVEKIDKIKNDLNKYYDSTEKNFYLLSNLVINELNNKKFISLFNEFEKTQSIVLKKELLNKMETKLDKLLIKKMSYFDIDKFNIITTNNNYVFEIRNNKIYVSIIENIYFKDTKLNYDSLKSHVRKIGWEREKNVTYLSTFFFSNNVVIKLSKKINKVTEKLKENFNEVLFFDNENNIFNVNYENKLEFNTYINEKLDNPIRIDFNILSFLTNKQIGSLVFITDSKYIDNVKKLIYSQNLFITIFLIILIFISIFVTSSLINQRNKLEEQSLLLNLRDKELEKQNSNLKVNTDTLNQTIKDQEEVIEIISHQWKQPLTALQGLITRSISNFYVNLEDDNYIDFKNSLINDKKFSREIQKKNINEWNLISHKNILKIEVILQELKDTIDTFKTNHINNFIFEDFSINNLIQDLNSTLYQEVYKENSINIEYNFNNNIIVYSAKNKIKQFLQVFINNSIDIVNENYDKGIIVNKKIIFKTYSDEYKHYLEIIDNGGEIDKEIFDKITTLYFSTKGKNCTGLGLYFAKKELKKMNSDFSFINEKGMTTVRISFHKNNKNLIENFEKEYKE